MLGLIVSSASGFVPTQQLPAVRSGRVCSSQVAMLSPAQEKKAEQLEQIQGLMEGKALAFAVRSEGIPVNALNDLRQKIPEGVEMQCIKNTLMRRAVGSEGLERFNAIAGGEGRKEFDVTRKSNYWFLVPEDKMRESVDLWNDWVKENNKVRHRRLFSLLFRAALSVPGVALCSHVERAHGTCLAHGLARCLDQASRRTLASSSRCCRCRDRGLHSPVCAPVARRLCSGGR